MRSLSEVELFRVWDAGGTESPGRRALLLLDAAGAGADPATLSIGCRDRMLLELRARSFGPDLDCLARCPVCNEQLSFNVPVAVLTDRMRPREPHEIALRCEGFEVRARVPTCADLAAVRPGGAAADLARRCLTRLECDGTELDTDAAPLVVLEAVDAQLAASDPDARMTIALACPTCEHVWEQGFDAARFVWAEVDARVGRLLGEVHRLASAYHWSESEILRLGSLRRQRYLELVDV